MGEKLIITFCFKHSSTSPHSPPSATTPTMDAKGDKHHSIYQLRTSFYGCLFLLSMHINVLRLLDEGGLCVQEYIRKRVLDIGTYILESSATVRQTADVFGVSKSTVHKDVTERLPLVNEKLSMEVKHILETNKAERHIRGGEATRKKYQEI